MSTAVWSGHSESGVPQIFFESLLAHATDILLAPKLDTDMNWTVASLVISAIHAKQGPGELKSLMFSVICDPCSLPPAGQQGQHLMHTIECSWLGQMLRAWFVVRLLQPCSPAHHWYMR